MSFKHKVEVEAGGYLPGGTHKNHETSDLQVFGPVIKPGISRI